MNAAACSIYVAQTSHAHIMTSVGHLSIFRKPAVLLLDLTLWIVESEGSDSHHHERFVALMVVALGG